MNRLAFALAVWMCFMLSIEFASGQDESVVDRMDNFKSLPEKERTAIFQDWIRSFNRTLQEDPLHEVLKETIITGNQIRVLLTNQGSISTPNAGNANADLVWPQGTNALGYSYEFGPLVASEVPSAFNPDSTLNVVNDGFLRRDDGDFAPGTAARWGWLPRKGFSDPRSKEVATFSDLDSDLDGKPDSWPETWYNATLGRYVWPAFLGDDATTPDEEVYYVMDDFNNAEFDYYPFPNDSTKRGLGIELQVRIFQFNNPLAEDIIFLVYTVTNISPKTLERVYLGMFGDPHVGGPNDYLDDNAGFISAFDHAFPFDTRNMLYAYDRDSRGDGGKRPGYFGYRFMESPGIDNDGFDNDDDDLTDESLFNDAGPEIFGPVGRFGEPKLHWSGDEDGDWNAEFDDVGVDGIAATGDFGESDGRPNQLFYLDLNNDGILDAGEPTSESRLEGMRFYGSEPNFGFVDIAESDQLGLTSFNALIFGGNNRPNNDPLMWSLMSNPNQRDGDPPPVIEQESDNVFIYSSGSFKLRPGESQRFSIALLLGDDFDDLLQNAQISQQVFESDYRFAKPPTKPIVTAVPGDRKVTLFWDTRAEESFDPFVARANADDPSKGFDFEGYRIYRSQDYSFNDTKTITDSKGIPFLSEPLQRANGVPAIFDLDNEFVGLAEVEYAGRGVRYNVGINSGLEHSFVDSNNVVNGVTYYYAVTSYDHGDLNAQLAPSESQRTIQRDALTRRFTFDVNTVQVVAGPPAGGYVDAGLKDNDQNLATQEIGNATGTVSVKILNPFAVVDGKKYDVVFDSVQVDSQTTIVGYSVVDLQPQSNTFVSRDTVFVNLSVANLVPGTVTISTLSGSVIDPSAYELDMAAGRIRGTSPGALARGQSFRIDYKYKPVANSKFVSGEDSNPVFDGMRVFVRDQITGLDPSRSGFKVKETNTNFVVQLLRLAEVGNPRPYPTDFEIHFVNYDTSADGRLVAPADTSIITRVVAPFRVFDVTTGKQLDFLVQESQPRYRNRRWDYQEAIVILEPDYTNINNTVYQVTFSPRTDTIRTSDGTADSLVIERPAYPGEGDVFLIFSSKPFDPGDKYSFSTRAVRFDQESAKSALDDIHVVPNPYIAYSAAEIAGPRSGVRDDRRLEFRNLPQVCTIRIFTITGELVDTIEKNDNRDFATWDLLTNESQQTAYGLYIYHVDAPDIGTKIGRFALIK